MKYLMVSETVKDLGIRRHFPLVLNQQIAITLFLYFCRFIFKDVGIRSAFTLQNGEMHKKHQRYVAFTALNLGSRLTFFKCIPNLI